MASELRPVRLSRRNEREHAGGASRGAITATPTEIVDLLRDPAGATIGPRKSLITRGGLVSPSDHLVVAGIVAIARGRDTAPRLSARVYAATAVAHRPE